MIALWLSSHRIEMHNLIAKYFKGNISSEERERLFAGLESDPALKKEFADTQNLHALLSWYPSDADEAEAVGRLLDFKLKRKKEERSVPWKHIIGYAAAVILSIFATGTVIHQQVIKDKLLEQRLAILEEMETTYEEFTAPSGQRALVKLQDGTTVWLNAKTTLRYPNKFSRTERRVELDGEAFFDVKENKEIPFIVATNKLNIKVTGTSFNVFAYRGEEESQISLTEGSVWVYDKRNETNGLKLEPNERAVLTKNQLYKQSFTQMDFLLWKDGIYAFDNLPFKEIVNKLQLYYDVNIEVENDKLNNYQFSGKFRQRDGVENVLRALRNIRYFGYTKDDEANVITIR